MSFVGGGYEFDVFVSYSHGTAGTERDVGGAPHTLRDWTRNLADTLADNLRMALNVEGDSERKFTYFLDEREFDSGEPISQTIREAAAKSAILLVFASPYYFRSSYCLDEVRAFFDQAGKDGRGREHCVIREVQPTPEKEWPEQLRDPEGRVVNRGESLFDPETNLPIDIDSFRDLGKTPALSGPRSRLTIAINKKLRDLRDQIKAREEQEEIERERKRQQEQALTALQCTDPKGAAKGIPDLDRKSVYLQAECENVAAWSRIRDKLSTLVLVNPSELKNAVSSSGQDEAAPSLLTTYEARRRNLLRFCNGLVLLRAKPDDDMDLQLMAARYDLSTLRQAFRQTIPWAMVDEVDEAGGEPAALRNFEITRIPTSLPDWPERVVGALGFAAAHA
ncbi:MAG: toll/interleukin-1 receptor domain-containing protein [Sphingomonadaceae bacterium]|nr:toll/interleukin-1 receptor domain-containing protein [Sphingomonadaceae bacterium]